MTPLDPDADERSLNLAIFGASSPVGRALVAQALDAGHRLTALTPHPERMPRDGALRVVHATPADVPALSDAILGVDAVLCALPAFARGSQDVTGAARAVANITRVMRDLRVRRLVRRSGGLAHVAERFQRRACEEPRGLVTQRRQRRVGFAQIVIRLAGMKPFQNKRLRS